MTQYKETKRALQKLGFKVIYRWPEDDRHVLLYDGKYYINLLAFVTKKFWWRGCEWYECDTTRYHATMSDGVTPVSWHQGRATEGFINSLWIGENYHIKSTPIEEGTYDYEIYKAMRGVEHRGHFCGNYSENYNPET